ncbi:MAG TPA: ATP-binding protein [Longimicrobiales bacterium]|nr:ATP-binding protein [Longimicrobiales bacterium]
MSLRLKVLLLFVGLAIAPILAVGLIDFAMSVDDIDQLVAARLEAGTERAARQISSRFGALELRVVEMAGSAAARRLVAGPEAGGEASPEPKAELQARWATLMRDLESLEVRDAAGVVVFRAAGGSGPGAPFCPGEGTLQVSRPITDRAGRYRGELVARAWVAAVLPIGLAGPVAEDGDYTLVVDRAGGRILHAPSCQDVGRSLAEVMAARWGLPPGTADSNQILRFKEGGPRLGYVTAVQRPEWTLVSTGSLDEVHSPYGQRQLAYLAFVMVIALAAAGAFSILIRDVMRSLEDLTGAAGQIADGDFNVWLPPPTNDEVGRLSLAFARMMERIRQSAREVESSRNLAALGEMASHLSHEIRNPLSALRVNLQSVEREARDGRLPDDFSDVMRLCLGEISRLDAVVQSVLTVGRGGPVNPRRESLHRIVDECVALLAADLASRRIKVQVARLASLDRVVVDAKQIKGVLLNLLLNAADAMPDGGTIRVWTEVRADVRAGGLVAVHVADEGSGVPPELRERIFQPFFTTKKQGSGIGLAVARRTVDQHGGRLYFDTPSELVQGAEFVVELPLAPPTVEPEPAADAARGRRLAPAAGETLVAVGGDASPESTPRPDRIE